MYICFAEYRIAPEHRQAYISYIEQLRDSSGPSQLYEGTDQPNLFVELWSAATLAQAEQMKEERRCERSPWFKICDWIDGGAPKLHVWTFKPL